jgi:hypothetical protein
MTFNETKEQEETTTEELPVTEDEAVIEPGPGPKLDLESEPKKADPSNVISMKDADADFDPSVDIGRVGSRAANPFAPENYDIKLLKVRYFPRNPDLDIMKKTELLEYCIKNELFADGWKVIHSEASKDAMFKYPVTSINITKAKETWSLEKIREFIDITETHFVPAHWLVFTNLPPTKRWESPKQPGVAHTIALKSWITKRHQNIWFEMAWPLPTPENPYTQGKPQKCAIVDDDSIRAQLLYIRQPRTGAVVPREVNGISSYFLLSKEMDKSSNILRNIFTRGTKGSKDLQKWGKEMKGGIPNLM